MAVTTAYNYFLPTQVYTTQGALQVSKASKIIITGSMVTFSTRRGGPYVVRNNHPWFVDIKKVLQEGDTGKAYRLYNKKAEAAANRRVVKLVGNELEFDGKRFHPAFAEAYALSTRDGAGIEALNLFFQNLSENPSPISTKAFTNFMATTRMPITDRGTFLAYKRVNSRFLDHHTMTFDNRPGSVLKMNRERVDADQNATCSTGFHVCSHTYLDHFSAGPDLVVEINPRDVVAVPPDYSLSKMRLASYRVLCTLPYFKKQLLNHYQDALGSIPFFVTAQTDSWNVLEDVPNAVALAPHHNFMRPQEWLADRSVGGVDAMATA